ncbi:MAG: O-antigen ligase family protein [Acholeplasmatales bacterium]|nr:O-antigen ligase family protein [Acholeplasmatales bacterium]
MVNNIVKKLNNIINMKYFFDVYLVLLSIITITSFIINPVIGIETLIITMILLLLLTSDMKYIIPNLLFLIFNFNNGFKVDEFPLFLIINVAIIIITLVIFMIKNRVIFNKMQSWIGFVGLAIVEFIPIFWNKTITDDNKALYVLYFANIGYFLLYALLVNGIKSKSNIYLAKSISYLLIIIPIECIYKVSILAPTVDNMFTLHYFIGWGMCNEASIMILVALPFSFYLITKEKNIYLIMIEIVKIIMAIVGVIFTFSRGGYIFLPIELLALVTLAIIFNYKRNGFKYFVTCISISLILFLIIKANDIPEFNNNVLNVVFKNGLSDSGRINLYKDAFKLFNSNGLYNLFGSGIVSEVRTLPTAYGIQENAVVIYHSTLFETLVIGGLIGFIFILILIKDKYSSLIKTNKHLLSYLLVGYLVVEIYGLFDNTYHMYYYMIIMAIIMAVIDNDNYYDNKRKDYYKLF